MKETTKLLWLYILFICIVALLASCSTTKKIKSVKRSSVDSSSITKIDSVINRVIDSVKVKKDNTVTLTEKQDDYKKETVIEYNGLTRKQVDSMIRAGRPEAVDYFPVRVTIKETGTRKERAAVVADTYDSSRIVNNEKQELTKTVKTDLDKTETVKEKDVKKKSYWGWLWIGLAGGGIVALYLVGKYYGWWKWIIALFKRRRDEDYPVRYTNYKLPENKKKN